jgi:predicted Zn-dependent protease
VNTGLLAAARTEGELAAVIAHEMGHQVKRHVAKAISRDTMFRSLAAFAVGGNASQWVQLAAALGVTTGQLHFGREAERQADRVMVELMLAAGYDPRQALAMFDTIRRVQGRGGGGMFSSHPPTQERAQNVRKLIDQRGLGGRLATDSRRFHEIKSRLRGRG